jgi:MtfA peptidase
MRRRRNRDQLPEEWHVVAAERLRQWPLLDAAEQRRLEQIAMRLLAKRWEGSHGFTVDDPMRVTVAVHAALLHLGVDFEPFANVTSIVIHPTTIVLRGERPGPFPGVMTDAPLPAHGHTSARGPVFIAWDTVERELRTPHRTSNVILHEFAHKIDALNGTFDGTPRLPSNEQLQEWVQICTAELAALRRGESGVLRPYAATNPSEFFAVATEAFFEQPVALRAAKPQLYGILARYFGQDTAAREAPAPDAAPAPGPAPHPPAAITSRDDIAAAVTRIITSSG